MEVWAGVAWPGHRTHRPNRWQLGRNGSHGCLLKTQKWGFHGWPPNVWNCKKNCNTLSKPSQLACCPPFKKAPRSSNPRVCSFPWSEASALEAGFSRVPRWISLPNKAESYDWKNSPSRCTFQLRNLESHKILVPFRLQRIAIFLWGIPRSVEETSGSLFAGWAFVFSQWCSFHILYLLWRDSGASAEVRVCKHLSFPRSEP